MIKKLLEMGESLLHLVYPRNCVSCGWDLYAEEECLCLKCSLTLPISAPTLCHPQMLELFFGRCHWENGILFLKMEKTGTVRQLVHSLKYQNNPDVGVYLGKIWGAQLKRCHPELPWDLVVPVPMHPAKKKARGYNQCDAIAQGFSISTGIPVEYDVLERIILKESQTVKGRRERGMQNENPFSAKKPRKTMGKRVLIMDDVVTTGATLESCYRAIQEIHPIHCSVGALAYPIHNRVI